MQTIDKNYLKSLNPCADRYKNYLQYYSEFSGSFIEFLNLDNITYDDKIWVAKQLLSKAQAIRWAIYCAKSVLEIYETKYPHDKRLRAAIDAALAYETDQTENNKNFAYAAAKAAQDSVHDAIHDTVTFIDSHINAAYAVTYAIDATINAVVRNTAVITAYAAVRETVNSAVHSTNTAALYYETRTIKQKQCIEFLIKAYQEVQ